MRASQVKPVRQMYVELMITDNFTWYLHICLSTENYQTDAWETKATTIDVVVITWILHLISRISTIYIYVYICNVYIYIMVEDSGGVPK